MSLEKDVTQIRVLIEQEMVFKPASPENLARRVMEVAKQYIATSTGRKVCTFCKRSIPKNSKYLSVEYRSQWGRQTKGICKDCLRIVANALG